MFRYALSAALAALLVVAPFGGALVSDVAAAPMMSANPQQQNTQADTANKAADTVAKALANLLAHIDKKDEIIAAYNLIAAAGDGASLWLAGLKSLAAAYRDAIIAAAAAAKASSESF